jgi:deoxyribodipyrimidine photolyase-related protein
MILLIFSNQLFENNELLKLAKKIYIIEDELYFKKYKYHKMKLILHRATMKYYYDYIYNNYTKKIYYINFNENYDNILNDDIIMYDTIDLNLNEKIKKLCKKNITIYESPLFLETLNDLLIYKNEYTKDNIYHHDNFYKWQRKRLNILMNNDTPLYNKWSFDKENRFKFDKNYEDLNDIKIINNDYINEAKKYIMKHFKNNFGDIDNFIYPITFEENKKHFKLFLNNRIKTFGKYQDGVSKNILFGSHSLISMSLNIGLIDIKYIINKIMKYFDLYKNKNEIINSIEGFIRQIIGWRSFVRFIYIFHYKEIIKMNNLNHNNKLNDKWFNGSLGIEPIDYMINKVKKYGYLHHIERLMYMGNFFLLCNINPNDVYKWFMICFIDSYEWVMVANVYCMSQYANNPNKIQMMTRPYFSSYNYIIKMSDFKKDEWCIIWEALYYNFINNNKDMLKNNYSTAIMVKHWLNKSIKQKKELINIAKKYLY